MIEFVPVNSICVVHGAAWGFPLCDSQVMKCHVAIALMSRDGQSCDTETGI
jgi:hypothetical protein